MRSIVDGAFGHRKEFQKAAVYGATCAEKQFGGHQTYGGLAKATKDFSQNLKDSKKAMLMAQEGHKVYVKTQQQRRQTNGRR